MRQRDLSAYYRTYSLLIAGKTQSQIAEIMKVSRSTLSRKVKYLTKAGILKEEIHSSIKTYIPGPGAAAFIDKVKEVIKSDTGGIEGIFPPAPGEMSSTRPPLDHFIGRTPRVHNLQYVVYLKRKGLPSLPLSISWKKEWETKGKTRHYSGYVDLPGWEKPAHVHYVRSSRDTETLQITLPAVYILAEWLKDIKSVEDYFDEVAFSVAQLFRKAGYEISRPELQNRMKEYAFEIPLLRSIKDLKARMYTETLHVDFSKGHAELESTDGEEAALISEAIPLIPLLPGLARKVEEHEQILHSLHSMAHNDYSPKNKEPEGGMYI